MLRFLVYLQYYCARFLFEDVILTAALVESAGLYPILTSMSISMKKNDGFGEIGSALRSGNSQNPNFFSAVQC